MNTCLTQSEAQAKVGAEVVTVAALPDIPIGTRGRIVAVGGSESPEWFVRVQWHLPWKRSEIMALVGDISINIPWKTKRAPAEFSKREFERLFKPAEQESGT